MTALDRGNDGAGRMGRSRVYVGRLTTGRLAGREVALLGPSGYDTYMEVEDETYHRRRTIAELRPGRVVPLQPDRVTGDEVEWLASCIGDALRESGVEVSEAVVLSAATRALNDAPPSALDSALILRGLPRSAGVSALVRHERAVALADVARRTSEETGV